MTFRDFIDHQHQVDPLAEHPNPAKIDIRRGYRSLTSCRSSGVPSVDPKLGCIIVVVRKVVQLGADCGLTARIAKAAPKQLRGNTRVIRRTTVLFVPFFDLYLEGSPQSSSFDA